MLYCFAILALRVNIMARMLNSCFIAPLFEPPGVQRHRYQHFRRERVLCQVFLQQCGQRLGQGGEGFTSFSIASPSGDGMTRPLTFTRERRIAVVGALRIV